MKDNKMKLTKFANLLVIALVMTVAASGCKKKPVGVTPLPNPYASKPKDVGPGGTTLPSGPRTPLDEGVGGKPLGAGTGTDTSLTGGHPSNEPGSHQGWIEDTKILQADTVYFDFDSSVIKASEKSKVAAVADYLKANKGKAVRVEGNCDERGTEEYNRALGDRRAQAVREHLISLGVSPADVDTKSWGKDNPDNDPSHDEAAWSKNRRDDFILLTPPAK
jgi:peptidoglycan-associated lipoprotein